MKPAFKPGEPPKIGSDFRVGRIDWHNPQIPCFVRFVALRDMPACFGPTGLGTAERGKTETRWNLAIAFPSVLFLEELSPENQKTRLAILIADGAPISRWPGFFHAAVCRGLSR